MKIFTLSCVPFHSAVAQELYRGFGGTQKGLSLKDLVCGLALLAHGSVDEKAKCEDITCT